MKRILLLIVSFLLLTGGIPGRADNTAAVLHCRCDSQNKMMTAQLIPSGQPVAQKILFTLLRSGEPVTEQSIASEMIDCKEAAYSGGAYTAVLRLSDSEPSGWYTVAAGDCYAKDDVSPLSFESRKASVYFADEQEIEDALSAVNHADDSDILSVLEQKGHIFGIDTTEYFNTTLAIAFMSEMKKKTTDFVYVQDVYDTFCLAKAVSAVLTEQTDVQKAVEENAALTGLDTAGDYTLYKQAAITLFGILRKPISAGDDALAKTRQWFAEAIALAVLNNTGRTGIDGVLTRYNQVFGLDLTGAYASLDKIQVAKSLEYMNFTSVDQVKTAFNDKVTKLTAPVGKSPGTSSGSKGRTVKSEIPYVPVTPQPIEDAAKQYFCDLGSVSWAEKEINALCQKGILSGYGNGFFMPEQSITREEFIKIAVSAFNLKSDTAVYDFTDGDAKEWYAPFSASAKAKGVISGYPDGSFGVGQNLTREDMAVMICRLTGIKAVPGSEPFADDSDIADYAKEAVYALRDAGIIRGMDGNKFVPKGYATRAETAKIISAAIGGKKDE